MSTKPIAKGTKQCLKSFILRLAEGNRGDDEKMTALMNQLVEKFTGGHHPFMSHQSEIFRQCE